jgi:hypothetical protein
VLEKEKKRKEKKKNTLSNYAFTGTHSPTFGIATHALLRMRGEPDLVVVFRNIIGKLSITSLIWHNVLADDPIFHTVTEMYASRLT